MMSRGGRPRGPVPSKRPCGCWPAGREERKGGGGNHGGYPLPRLSWHTVSGSPGSTTSIARRAGLQDELARPSILTSLSDVLPLLGDYLESDYLESAAGGGDVDNVLPGPEAGKRHHVDLAGVRKAGAVRGWHYPAVV